MLNPDKVKGVKNKNPHKKNVFCRSDIMRKLRN